MSTHPTEHHAAEPDEGQAGVSFLLAQLGAHATERFTDRIAVLGLTPPHAGILRAIRAVPGQSQQALGAQLGLLPSRMVNFVDDLESRGLVERRRNPTDRRLHALHLTPEGRERIAEIGRLASEHESDFFAALSTQERGQLTGLLRRVAAHQGIAEGVHPGYRHLNHADQGEAVAPVGE